MEYPQSVETRKLETRRLPIGATHYSAESVDTLPRGGLACANMVAKRSERDRCDMLKPNPKSCCHSER